MERRDFDFHQQLAATSDNNARWPFLIGDAGID
jgi:hypothetical protein